MKFNPQLTAAVSSIVLVLSSGTIIFHRLENWTWTESLYFTVVTTTTVGYGDLHPTSDASRFIAIFFILFGVGVLITAISYLGAYFINRGGKRIRRK